MYIPKDCSTDGSEKKGESDSSGDVVSRPVELLFEAGDGKGNSKEIPGINSPSKPSGEEHSSLERSEHHGELEGVQRSAISCNPTLLLGGQLEETVSKVEHGGDSRLVRV